MTDRRTSLPSSRLWTGIITLLMLCASVRSQSAVNGIEASTTQPPPIEERLESLQFPSRAEPIVVPASTTVRNAEATDHGSTQKIYRNDSSEGYAKQGDPDLKKNDKLQLPERGSEAKTLGEKHQNGKLIVKSGDKENYDEIRELDEDFPEAIGSSSKKVIKSENGSPAREKDAGEELDYSWMLSVKENPKKIFKHNFSLINDTNVNYNRKKVFKSNTGRETDVYEDRYKDSKNIKETPQDLAGSEDAENQENDKKGPKSQVELIKESTLPIRLRLREDSLTTKPQLPTPTQATTKSQDAGDPNDKTNTATFMKSQISEEKNNFSKTVKMEKSASPSIVGTNDATTAVKNVTEDPEKNVVTENVPIKGEITEISEEEKKVPTVKLETADPAGPPLKHANSSDPASPESVILQTTEAASALENTIGRREEKKIFLPETSPIIDNSIHQLKPNHPKRSGNSSKINGDFLFPTSPFNLMEVEKSVTTANPISTNSNSPTSDFPQTARVPNTENDVPSGSGASTGTENVPSDHNGPTGSGITSGISVISNSSTTKEAVDETTIVLHASTVAITQTTKSHLPAKITTTRPTTSAENVVTTTGSVETIPENVKVRNSPLSMKMSTTTPPTDSLLVKPISQTPLMTSTTSPRGSSVENPQEVTISGPKSASHYLAGETLDLEESTTWITMTESTTAKVEYEFVGLTETTLFEKSKTSTDSPKLTSQDNGEKGSSTTSRYSTTSGPTLLTILTTPQLITTEPATTETEKVLETQSATIPTEIEPDEYSTTSSSTQLPEETYTSRGTEIPVTLSDLTTPEMTDSTEIDETTDYTKVTESIMETTEDPEVFVDFSTTILPEMTTLTESLNPDVVARNSTNLSEYSETITGHPSKDFTSTTESLTTSTMEILTTTPVETTTDVPSTTQSSINVITSNVTSPGNRAVSQEELASLVRIIFEGDWPDVCPHLPSLRQSLADLLTSAFEKTVLANQIIYQKNPCTDNVYMSTMMTELAVTSLLLYVVDETRNFDAEMTKMLPSLYNKAPIKLQVTIHSFQLVQDVDSGNAIAVVVVSCVAFICLVLLAGLLFIMRKRQARFNYGERCRPVSLDAYSLDSRSAYNSVRGRKAAVRASKRSYGNPTFEDSTATPSHPLNFNGLSTFCNEQNTIAEEFARIPQVTARIDELPQGAEVKNRYANVVPLPETRVTLMKINDDPLTEYINASYVRGPKNASKYYIACQAPMESTVTDFWRMIWEQQTKVIIMLTDLVENGVEKCTEYIPPSEVTDCHRLFGDYQITLKKRETKEKYAISTLSLKNLENNTFREVSHIWYLWPTSGVHSDAASLIAILLEARALQRGGAGPVVVHCSPGTGRTGTLIALDLGIRQYEITRTVDVPRVVYTIRRDRAGSVQTKEQYAFIYKALNLYATKLAGGGLESQ